MTLCDEKESEEVSDEMSEDEIHMLEAEVSWSRRSDSCQLSTRILSSDWSVACHVTPS